MNRIAVVLFNLGGPDRLEAVRPFLFRLFNDPAIIPLPWPVRPLVAALIAAVRSKSSAPNYARMGGASPLLPQTQDQADRLRAELARRLPGDEVRTFLAMRYWNPDTDAAAKAVAAFAPDEVLLLPLYPQYSTTTTGSSLKAWRKAYRGPGRTTTICCYPEEPGFIEAHARAILRAHAAVGRPGPLRLIFSAHGLPQKVIDAGDPYESQVERTCAAIVAQLGPDWAADWDWRIGYQSRVGPMKWLGPTTMEQVEDATKAGRGVLVTPVAFVSEHVETLVELDHDYAGQARALGAPFYLRAPAIGSDMAFIEGLADLAQAALGRDGIAPGSGRCEPGFAGCACRGIAA